MVPYANLRDIAFRQQVLSGSIQYLDTVVVSVSIDVDNNPTYTGI